MDMINARPWTQSRTAIWYPLPGHRNADVLLASMQVFSHLSSLSPRSVPLLQLTAAEWHAWHERVAMQYHSTPHAMLKSAFRSSCNVFSLRESKVPIPPTHPRRTRGNKASLKLLWTTTLPSSNMAKLRRYFLGRWYWGGVPWNSLAALALSASQMDPTSEAYWGYLRVRANFFNASFITSEDLAIVRLACLSRVHDRQAFICVQPDLAK